MLLQRLKEYATTRMEAEPKLYSRRKVRYILDLREDGTASPYLIDLAGSEKETKGGIEHMIPAVTRTVAIAPLLLVDKASYVLGYSAEDGNPERAQREHAAFTDLARRCAERTQEPTVHAIIRFLEQQPLVQLQLPADFDPGGLILFRVGDIIPIHLPSVQQFWAEVNGEALQRKGGGLQMECVVCGNVRPVLPTLQGNLKRIPGGQTSGVALISANASAFESYGLEKSLIAPTCEECGEQFTNALNDLLTSDQHRISLGDAVCVSWTRKKSVYNFMSTIADPKQEQVTLLLRSVREGKLPPEMQNNAFYALVLSASGGRAVVRDWIDTTLDTAARNTARWFQMQDIVDEYGQSAPPLSLFRLAVSTVREAKDLPKPLMRSLVRSALLGTPLPKELLFQAVRRNRAAQGVSFPRAALIKLVLISHQSIQENTMIDLDANESRPAYRCGRLLAVLESIQYRAIPNANATIVDRFYGTASAAPVAVFGRLVRGAQAHLSKIRGENEAAYVALQRRMEDVLSGLDTFPRTLSLEDQGIFALGYYHQRANDRAQAAANAGRRKTATEDAN